LSLLLLLLAIILIAAVASGCTVTTSNNQQPSTTTPETTANGTKSATIRITGTSGTPFKGSYGSTRTGIKSVEAKIPQDYEVRYFPQAFDTLKANIQKQTADDSKLTLQIIVDGETKEERTTATDFGVVLVSWSPSEG
jgi:ABC-type glycerol-3-phosphate transport system substrate-binding protein